MSAISPVDSKLEAKIIQWLCEALPQHSAALTADGCTLQQFLKSGIVLCELVNSISPGSVSKISTLSSGYKQMENITNYLRACLALGVPKVQSFDTIDLHENRNFQMVLLNLEALQQVAQRAKSRDRIASRPIASTPTTAAASSPTGPVTKLVASTTVPATSPQPILARSPSKPLVPQTQQVDVPLPEQKPVNESELVASKLWIEGVLGVQCPVPSFIDWIKSGVVLCKMLNVIRPGLVSKIYEGPVAYQQIENLQRYLRACKIIGMNDLTLFDTNDLFLERNINIVLNHIHVLARKVQTAPNWSGPSIDDLSAAPVSPLKSSIAPPMIKPDVQTVTVSVPDPIKTVAATPTNIESTPVKNEPTIESPSTALKAASAELLQLQQEKARIEEEKKRLEQVHSELDARHKEEQQRHQAETEKKIAEMLLRVQQETAKQMEDIKARLSEEAEKKIQEELKTREAERLRKKEEKKKHKHEMEEAFRAEVQRLAEEKTALQQQYEERFRQLDKQASNAAASPSTQGTLAGSQRSAEISALQQWRSRWNNLKRKITIVKREKTLERQRTLEKQKTLERKKAETNTVGPAAPSTAKEPSQRKPASRENTDVSEVSLGSRSRSSSSSSSSSSSGSSSRSRSNSSSSSSSNDSSASSFSFTSDKEQSDLDLSDDWSPEGVNDSDWSSEEDWSDEEESSEENNRSKLSSKKSSGASLKKQSTSELLDKFADIKFG